MKLFKMIIATALMLSTAAFSQVNINTATAKELTALMGIGPVKSAAIIKYRKANGKFKKVIELTKVEGIGEGIVKKLGSDLTVTAVTNISNIKNKSKSPTKKKATKATKKPQGKKEAQKTKSNIKGLADKTAKSKKINKKSNSKNKKEENNNN